MHFDSIDNLPPMPQKLWRECSRSFKTKKKSNRGSWLAIPIDGTTFSGHPTRTTLGNTLRTICYMFYYMECAGIDNPWKNDDCFIAASGDDIVVWIDSEIATRLKNVIASLSFRDKNDHDTLGLGQVIKEVKLSGWYDFDF